MSQAETEIRVDQLRQVIVEFAEVFSETREFQAFEEAQEALNRDEEAQRAIARFQELQRLAWFGLAPGGKDLKLLRQQLLAMPTVKAYLEAQEDLIAFAQKVSAIVSEVIEMDFGTACAPAGGCC